MSSERWQLSCPQPARCMRALIVFLILGNIGFAQEIINLHEDTLRVEVSFPLPAEIARGVAPVFVDLENEAAEERVVDLQFEPQQWNFDCRVSQRVTVPAGGRVRAELLIPAWMSSYGGKFEVTSGRSSESRWLRIDAGRADGLVEAVVLVTDEPASAAQVEGWTEILARAEVQLDGQAVRNVSAAALEPADLPRRFESYSGISAIVIDASARVDSPDLAPLLQWTRLGGTLIFSGADARAAAAALPELAVWMEPRFRVDGPASPVSAVSTEETSIDGFQLGLGVLVIAESPEFLDASQSEAFRWGIFDHAGFVPRRDLRAGFLRELDIPGVRELPYRVFIVLLFVFCGLIGPVNFSLVKKTGRPAWLLFTIPFLALLASAGFLAYGIFYQGVDLREASETFTLLDQRQHRSDSVALRSIFAGLSPADGLHPGPGTVVLPVPKEGNNSKAFYGIEMGSELTLTGEFLPVRKEGTQLILSESSARGRLQFTRAGAGFELANGFSVPVLRACLSASDGTLHLFEGDENAELGPGESSALKRSTGMQGAVDLTAWLPEEPHGRELGWAADLPPGTFLAIVESNPFVDACGLDPGRRVGRHVVLGVLPAREPQAGERWE